MYLNNDAAVHKAYVQQLIAGKADKQPSSGNGEGVYKLTKDSRITRVGAFLRKTSMDELPQFINVLKGEMSLVGPRPPVPYEVEAYDIWHRRRLLEAKPGITGLWQVGGRSRVKFDDMVRLDLQYARTWSPWMDIKILAAHAWCGSARQRRALDEFPLTITTPPPMEVLSKMATLLTRPQNENALPESRSEVMVKFGVVGYGYWGPNVVRNLDRLDEAKVVAVCDKSLRPRRKSGESLSGRAGDGRFGGADDFS